MNYFSATFYDSYTLLTPEQIQAKLTPVPGPVSASPPWDGLTGRSLKIVLDNGPVLEYAFAQKTLAFSEGGAPAAEAPYLAKELNGLVLASHMIPGTVRGYCLVIDTGTNLVTRVRGLVLRLPQG